MYRQLIENLEEARVIECVLKENNTLFKLRFAFIKNPVTVYDETTIQLLITPIITLYFETIVIYFTESKLNTEVTIQSELKALTEYDYRVPIYIDPTTPRIVRIKNTVISIKTSEYAL